mmetsp:Transcript_24259/g.43907  ORF Transcript_24259/g.43907 Transcript_24259/m.43907 type:complete len:319 (-) Transcript_24259:891-1847(-)
MRDPVIMKSRFRTRKVQARVATVEALVVKRLHALWHLLLGDLLASCYLLHVAKVGCLTFVQGRNTIWAILAGHLSNSGRQLLDVPRLLDLTVYDMVNVDGHEVEALASGRNVQECFFRRAAASGNKDPFVTYGHLAMIDFFHSPLDVWHGRHETFDEIGDAVGTRTGLARFHNIGMAVVVCVVAFFGGFLRLVVWLTGEAFAIHVLEASWHGVSSRVGKRRIAEQRLASMQKRWCIRRQLPHCAGPVLDVPRLFDFTLPHEVDVDGHDVEVLCGWQIQAKEFSVGATSVTAHVDVLLHAILARDLQHHLSLELRLHSV